MTSRSLRGALVGIAAGVLLALVLAPQSRWLVQYQLAAIGFSPPPLFPNGLQTQNTAARVTRAHPGDYALQWAAATEAGSSAQRSSALADGLGSSTHRVAALRALTTHFSDKPSLYAALLRNEVSYSAGGDTGVYLSRPEESELLASTEVGKDKPEQRPSPAALAAFDAEAARGEALDPSNAYFPLMRAIGLFAAHRDAAGLAAVQRASTKPVWNEYLTEEVSARLRLADSAYGHGMVISHIAISASELYPQYGPLRAMARLVVVLAVHAEQAGDAARGMSIRRSLMQCGDLMRVQGTSYICNFVGGAISAIARSRPGGGVQTRPRNMDDINWTRVRQAEFVDYAQRAGFPADAARARGEYAASVAVKSVLTRSDDKSLFNTRRFVPLGIAWGSSLLTLVNALWLLALGAIAVFLCRLPSVQVRQPLPAAARWGVLAACALTVFAAVFGLADAEARASIALAATLVVAGSAGVGVLVARRNAAAAGQRAREFGRAFGVALAALGAIALVAAWQTRGVVAFAQAGTDLAQMSGGGYNGPANTNLLVGLFVVGAGLLVPGLLAAVLSIRARVRREPAGAALAQGFRGAAVPLACILLIAYGPCVLATLRQERQMDSELQQMIRHEGHYYASLAGVPWPGPTLERLHIQK